MPHGQQHLIERQSIELVGRAAGEQFVEHDAQSVNVACVTDRGARQLFRACIRRRQAPILSARGWSRLGIGRRIEQFGDAEIEQLGHAIISHQYVSGLQVTVHDVLPVCVRHRQAHLAKEAQAVFEAESSISAVTIDRLAFDVLHHEVRRAVRARAAIDEPCDVGMFEVREDLALRAEPFALMLRCERAAQHLDRDLFAILVIRPFREIDHSHAAVLQRTQQAPRAQPLAARVHILQQTYCLVLDGVTDAVARNALRAQQRFDLPAQGAVVPALCIEARPLGIRVEVDCTVEERLDLFPALGVHDDGSRMAPCSQDSARRNSRWTVLGDTPVASAVSSIDSPPK